MFFYIYGFANTSFVSVVSELRWKHGSSFITALVVCLLNSIRFCFYSV